MLGRAADNTTAVNQREKKVPTYSMRSATQHAVLICVLAPPVRGAGGVDIDGDVERLEGADVL